MQQILGGPCVSRIFTGEFGWLCMRGFFAAGFGGLRLTETCAAGFGGVSGAGGAQQGWTFRDRAPPLGAVFGAVVHVEIWEELRAAKGLDLQVLGW